MIIIDRSSRYNIMKLSATLLLAFLTLQPALAAEPVECKATTSSEIQALFTRWNDSLLSLDYHRVVSENYAPDSILLPTVSNIPRITVESKEDYFHHFLENKPSGAVTFSYVQIGCNTAVDSGLYTFTFNVDKPGVPKEVHARYTFTYVWTGTKWLISSHHSSVNPVEIEAQIYNALP